MSGVVGARSKRAQGGRRGGGQRQRQPEAVAPPAEPKKKRDPLLAAICHDLRAPLAAVTMGTNFVLQTTPEGDLGGRSRRVLEAVLRSCGQMERLLRNFGDLSEIEAEVVNLRLGAQDAGELLALAVEGSREAATTKSVTLEIVPPSAPTTLTCDRDRLLRGISHVVENAVKAAPPGTTVTVSAKASGDDVVFEIVDHGPGLSAELREHLFDREWHAKRADRSGAGFGLAIAHGFVTVHGGSIEVASEPGETHFTLTVPKDQPTPEPET